MGVSVQSAPITEWKQLADIVDEYVGRGWIFRGVKRDNDRFNLTTSKRILGKPYPLIPSIGRRGNTQRINSGCRHLKLEDERNLLQLFKREARTRFGYIPNSDLEWLVLGQHHRLFTRLLDWSESVLVAAFFAVEEPRLAGAIYGVKAPQDLPLEASPFRKFRKSPLLVRPPHISPRITAQKGVLTLHSNPTEAWEDPEIRCWKISTTPRDALILKRKLAFAGIHEASLFPDNADRHTAYLSWRHKWSDLPRFSRSRPPRSQE